MENLNDLIWTDEADNENGENGTQRREMHQICMIAFCGGGISVGGSTAGNFYGCIQDLADRSLACL